MYFITFSEYPRCPPLLDDIENGQSSSENRTYAVAETIRFTCYPGYRTTTQSWRTCAVKYTGNRYVSEWLGETPECEGQYIRKEDLSSRMCLTCHKPWN